MFSAAFKKKRPLCPCALELPERELYYYFFYSPRPVPKYARAYDKTEGHMNTYTHAHSTVDCLQYVKNSKLRTETRYLSDNSAGWHLGTDCVNLDHSNWEAPETQLLAPVHAL